MTKKKAVTKAKTMKPRIDINDIGLDEEQDDYIMPNENVAFDDMIQKIEDDLFVLEDEEQNRDQETRMHLNAKEGHENKNNSAMMD